MSNRTDNIALVRGLAVLVHSFAWWLLWGRPVQLVLSGVAEFGARREFKGLLGLHYSAP
jgi:hypothetical protein